MNDPDSDFLHVAVARYADACAPPRSLHPDCPFAVPDGNGSATCQQECRDVLLRLSRPGSSGTSTPTIASVPFDARQLQLSEVGVEPMPTWQTASLMTTLRRGLTTPPVSRDGATILIRRDIDVTNALTYLSRRGFDIERLVREGFRELLPQGIAVWAATEYVRQQSFSTAKDAHGWQAVLEDTVGTIGEVMTVGGVLALMYNSGFIDHVKRWLVVAPLDDVINWRTRPDVIGDPVENDGTALWVLERFSLTFLDEWSFDSLRHEYRYARGDSLVGVPRMEMLSRVVDLTEVSKHIAERSVEAKGAEQLAQIKRQAILLLNDARRLEAASLFDAVRILEPNNSEAHNNYAFCLTLDEPETALEALQQSARLEQVPFAINRINQVVVLHRLGRDREALAMAEATYREHKTSLSAQQATLWDGFTDPEGPTLAHVNGLAYLCERGVEIADRIGDGAQAAIWESRKSTH